MNRAVGELHSRMVFGRRVRVLSDLLSQLLPQGSVVLDVGCGDGTIDSMILSKRPDVTVTGTDVLVRPVTKIAVREFDGSALPFADKSFDVVAFVDVLHHTNNAEALLAEAKRVARQLVVIKDHTAEGSFGFQVLRLMDWVGNAHYGVALPYNYWPKRKWELTFDKLGLEIRSWRSRLGLYPFPASLIFERGLHFIAALKAR